ncbi:unnamed protein product [Linum trigynum]|uniref:Uncharacterized protein n=1 Tax=Linum trigynum TaxID=586398 RepID=A0AAV2FRT2_9ROSI
MNEAFMIKIEWRLLTEKDSLWVQVIRGKYLRKTEAGWVPRVTGRLSNLWRGVIRVLHYIPEGSMWNINSGMQTLFWTDRWLQDGPPLAIFAINLPEAARGITVAEMVMNGSWNEAFARVFLPEDIVEQLLLHPIPQGIETDGLFGGSPLQDALR